MSNTRESVEHATREFNMIWQNDQDVYNAVIEDVRGMLRRVPGMTDQTIGRNVKDRVFAWAYGGGWGWPDGWHGTTESLRDSDRYPTWTKGGPPPGYRTTPFSYFLDKDQYGFVSEEGIAEQVWEAFDAEGYDRNGNVR